MNRMMFMFLRYRLALQGRAVGHHENLVLECLGLGNPRAKRHLRHMLREFNPNMAFIMETKLHNSKMERVRRSWGLVEGIDVSSEGSRGGLSLGWRLSLEISLKSFNVAPY